MTGLSVGSAAPEQTVPWERVSNLDHQSCAPGPQVKEVATWELAQKYFLDPTFGGASSRVSATSSPPRKS